MKNSESFYLTPGLYIVATPIGNLRDITLRALDVLTSVDLIICEDTRVSGKFLKHFEITQKMISYNDHSTIKQRDDIINKLKENKRIALISDAGMPLISDPGYKLIRTCLDQDIFVTSLPGANAPLAALQLSGLPSDKFSFLGFLPAKTQGRKKVMEEWAHVPGSLIVFESSPRLTDTLQDMITIWGDRPATVIREITKLYEQIRRDTLSELLSFYDKNGSPKGEIVIVIGATPPQHYNEGDICQKLKHALQTKSVKEAAAFVALETGWQKKVLYNLALKLKDSLPP